MLAIISKTFTPYRRNGIASTMLVTGIERIKSIGGEKIYAFIDQENVASINLHANLGFVNQKKESFDSFDQCDSELLYVLELNATAI